MLDQHNECSINLMNAGSAKWTLDQPNEWFEALEKSEL